MKKQPKSGGSMGRYLYAIIAGSQDISLPCLGIDQAPVYTISNRDLSAVVSDVPNRKIRPERRQVAAHQAVLKSLMDQRDVLPMAFGMISSGSDAVSKLLSRNRNEITGRLKRVSNKVEMGLKVCWDVENIFEYMISIHPSLMEARDRLLNSSARVSQSDKIEIGRLFEQVLESERNSHSRRVIDTLADKCSEIKPNPCRDEREVMRLACLVERNGLATFESGVFEAAGHFDDNFAFDYNGPWAPHNFVELNIRA